MHDLLNNEYIVESDKEKQKAIITVLDTYSGNWEQFNDFGFRRMLAWLLLDMEARHSYNSIAQSQLNYG